MSSAARQAALQAKLAQAYNKLPVAETSPSQAPALESLFESRPVTLHSMRATLRSMRASPAQLRTADEVSVTTRVASIFRASFATPSPTKNSRSNAGSPLASSSPQPKTVHSGQLLGSRALAASPNAVTADSDSWDTRITAGVVEAAIVPKYYCGHDRAGRDS